jgi:hypothetical protein
MSTCVSVGESKCSSLVPRLDVDVTSNKKSFDYCTQCREPILPGELYLDKFMVGEHAPMHEECYGLYEEDFEREMFWFDYVLPGKRCDCAFCRATTTMPREKGETDV